MTYDDWLSTEPDPYRFEDPAQRCDICGEPPQGCRCQPEDEPLLHYIPAFTTVTPTGLQRAVCGAAIGPEWHSAEADCPACRRWLESTEPLR